MVTKEKNIANRNRGFTLIELIIAMGISGIVLAAAFSVYKYHQQHYTAQIDVTEMQQNIRGALSLISRDIRMAGYDPDESSVAEIVFARPDLFYFTVDFNDDGDVDDPGEHIIYDLYTPNPPAAQTPTLGRTTSSSAITPTYNAATGSWSAPGHGPAAENIERLEFYYLDENGNATTLVDKIQTVMVTLLARADQPDPRFKNNTTYQPASAVFGSSGISWTFNDQYRRRLQMMTIECRNIGLN